MKYLMVGRVMVAVVVAAVVVVKYLMVVVDYLEPSVHGSLRLQYLHSLELLLLHQDAF